MPTASASFMLLFVSNVYRFAYQGHFDDGVQVVTGLHYQTDVPALGDEPAAPDVLDGIDGHLRSAFLSVIDSRITIDSAELRQMVTPGSGDVPIAASKVVNQPGGLGGTGKVLPDPLTMIIKLRSNAAIRAARSYMALPGPSSTSYLSASRQWTGSYYTAVQVFAALLDDILDAGSFAPSKLNPVNYSKVRHGLGLTPFTFAIVEGIPRQNPSWRRSRMSAP